MLKDYIHTPNDGRGLRDVFVNGRFVDRCFYADTKKGVADVYVTPLKIHKYGKRALTKRLHGEVVVTARAE